MYRLVFKNKEIANSFVNEIKNEKDLISYELKFLSILYFYFIFFSFKFAHGLENNLCKSDYYQSDSQLLKINEIEIDINKKEIGIKISWEYILILLAVIQ